MTWSTSPGIGYGRQDGSPISNRPQTVKYSRLQIALVCVLLLGASLLMIDRCAG